MIKRLLVVITILLSSTVFADELIMCSNGRVKFGDAYEKVMDAKCGTNLGNYSSVKIIDGQQFKYKVLKRQFSDGTKAVFFFLDDKFIDVVVFD